MDQVVDRDLVRNRISLRFHAVRDRITLAIIRNQVLSIHLLTHYFLRMQGALLKMGDNSGWPEEPENSFAKMGFQGFIYVLLYDLISLLFPNKSQYENLLFQ